MSRYFWTTPEIAIVRAHYAAHGVEACMQLLKTRTRGSIYQQAAKLGLSSRPERAGKPKRHYQINAFTDHAIRAVYENNPEKLAVRKLADRIGRQRWWVSKRAQQLGLVTPRFKEAAWTDEEMELLDAHAHKNAQVIARIFKARGYSRTATAINLQRKRKALGVTASRNSAGLYSANQVAILMGVDSKTITRWIRVGMLNARKRGTERTEVQGGDEWEVTLADVRIFVVGNPNSVDLRKVDRLWFIEMLGKAA
jgi:hypothetical protein